MDKLICKNCGWVLKSDAYNFGTKKAPLCSDCEGTLICRDCNEIIKGENHGNEYAPLCAECAENYYVCSDCGKIITDDRWGTEDMPICAECSINYCVCDNCETIYKNEDAFHFQDSVNMCDVSLCAECAKTVSDSIKTTN